MKKANFNDGGLRKHENFGFKDVGEEVETRSKFIGDIKKKKKNTNRKQRKGKAQKKANIGRRGEALEMDMYKKAPVPGKARQNLNKNLIKASTRFMNTGDVKQAIADTNFDRQQFREGIKGFDKSKLAHEPTYEKYEPVVVGKVKKKNKRESLPKRKNTYQEGEVLMDLSKEIAEILKTEAKAPYGRTKLMFVGEGRAGKTSTIKALLNKKFDPKEGSTKGFDLSRVDARHWEEDKGSYLVEHLQKVLQAERENKKTMRQKKDLKDIKDNEKVIKEAPKEIQVSEEEVFKYGQEMVLSEANKDPLSFSIWDFGGQKVFYTLHHLFLTEYGCYALVFNMRRLLDPKTQKETLDYLQFWLFSKKIHAPGAPIIIVGTRSDECSVKEIKKVQKILQKKVLKMDKFGEIANGHLCFFPIDNKSKANINSLRDKIEFVVRGGSYIKEEVPVSFLRALELLLESKKDYMPIEEAKEILVSCGIDDSKHDVLLEFLHQRGLVVYFSEPQSLREFVVMQPQWMIEALTDVFFDFEEHDIPSFNDEYNRDFRKFQYERILSKRLLTNIWSLREYSEKIQKFFIDLMKKSSLVCEYEFDNEDSFLVPSLFSTNAKLDKIVDDEIKSENGEDDEKQEYTGPYFVIDFSGKYDEEIMKDNGDFFVRYLPFGVFERLVCLCVEYSGSQPQSVKPKVSAKQAILSFGVEVDFQIKVENDKSGNPLWITVRTEESTEINEAKGLVKTIYAMIEGLKEDFFSKSNTTSKLAMSLLIPSSKATGEQLAEYENVKVARENAKSLDKKFRPSNVSRKKLKLSDYNQWFAAEGGEKEDLTNPDEKFDNIFKDDIALKAVGNKLDNAVGKMRPLPDGLKYHCFLSYKQSSAIDIVGKHYFMLTNLGFKCWYDQQFEGNLNLESMQTGVRDSMCYVLFLSQDIFPSPYVEEEVKMAIKLNKPIIFLHHPNTGGKNYWSFNDYIEKAPEIVKPLFSKVESIQLQRRFYLEQAVTEEIKRRLVDIADATTAALQSGN